MTRPRKIVLFAAILAGLAGTACRSPGGSQGKSSSDSITEAKFGVEYVYGGETFFESITLTDTRMTRRYFNDDGRCRKVSRSPCYTDGDLAIARAELSQSEMAEIETLARESGFMTSDPDPDGLQGKSLFYSYNLTIRLQGKNHTVRMGSFPGSASAPPVSRKLYLKLLDLAKRKGLSS